MNFTFDDIEKAKLQKSFFYFCQAAWRWTEGRPMIIEAYHSWLSNDLQRRVEDCANGRKRKGVIYCLPPGTSKSWIISKCLPAWVWLTWPNMRFLCGSFNSSRALDFATASRDIIQHSEFVRLFPNLTLKDDTNSKARYLNEHGGSRASFGADTSQLGTHSEIQILDDIMNATQMQSDTDRVRICNLVTSVLPTRSGNYNGFIQILVNQRIGLSDIVSHLQNYDMHQLVVLPASIETPAARRACTHPHLYTDNLLAPTLLSQERLSELQATLDHATYSSNYLQLPTQSEGALIKAEHIIILDKHPDHESRLYIILDSASTANRQSDYSAAIACTVHNGSVIIQSLFHQKLEYVQLKEKFTQWVLDQPNYSATTQVHIETKSSGISLTQDLKINSHFNIHELKNPGVSKQIRLEGVSARIIAGKLQMVRGPFNNKVIAEMTGQSSKEDIKDVCIYAVDLLCPARGKFNYMRSIGFVNPMTGESSTGSNDPRRILALDWRNDV